ncbi:MAG: hypothetical protein MUC49_15545 [Raineya sp.]|jgi:hypothetical protein|nr:hypothetical protein [Raineya sp.]
MILEEEILKLFPSFFKKYDANKDINNEGTLERFNKLLASEVDDNFMESLQNFLQNTLDVKNMSPAFLPYMEKLRGTDKFSFDFPPFDNQNASQLPSDILALMRHRILTTDRSKQNIRVDGANEYAIDYTDGVYVTSQAIAAAQPKITEDGWYFNGSNQQMVTNNIPDVVFAVVVANSTRNFVVYDCFISSYQGGVPYASIMGQNDTTLFQQVGSGQYTQSDMRVNNIPSTEFSPNNVFKVISAKFGTKTANFYDIGFNDGGNGALQGTIKDIMFFHTEPSEEQKTIIQNYLEAFHNL